MDDIVDLRFGSAELDFVNSISNPVVIKTGKIVATAIEIDSVEMLNQTMINQYSEPDDDKSILLAESVFSCVKRKDKSMYPCMVSDEAMDVEEKEFDLYMEIIELPLARPQEIPREKGTMLKCVHDLYVRASKNLSPQDSAKVKELLVEHNETTFHNPEKPLTRMNTIEHEIPMTGRLVRIPPRRVAQAKHQIT